MSTKIIMPQLGESIHEGTIGKWLKNEGESVKEFEPILEVTTDKVDTEITATTDGVLLKIEVPTGTTVAVGTVLGWIGQTAESPSNGNGHSASILPNPQTEVSKDIGFISPVVAKLAAEHKLNLASIKGTGLGGRITKKDVLAFVENGQQTPVAAPVGPVPTIAPLSPVSIPKPQPTLTPNPQPFDQAQGKPLTSYAGDTLVPLSTMRKAIADHMVRSKHTSPHVTTVFEVDLSQVIAHREANKAQFARDGVNLTITAYLISAIATALRAYPVVNSSYVDDKLLLRRDIHIGMAVSLGDDGLIVPVIKNADEKSLLGLARSVNDLANRARAKQLKPDEVQGGTFTLTNHGVSGSLFATPIINQPQCGILGVGAIQKRVVVLTDAASRTDSIAIRPMCYISLTFDHRILDGATADYFVAKVKDTLEIWS